MENYPRRSLSDVITLIAVPWLRLTVKPSPCGRQRCCRRLGYLECACEYGIRCKLGFRPSWRRRRHGLLPAAGMVSLDGSKEADERLSRVLNTDPGMGVIRHADAGYDLAIDIAKKMRIRMPMAGRQVTGEE